MTNEEQKKKDARLPKIASKKIIDSVEESHRMTINHLEHVQQTTGRFTIQDVEYCLKLSERELSFELNKD